MPESRKRSALRLAGIGLAGIGTVGIVVPLWPTTCFWLAAVWCFARSAPEWIEVICRVPGAGPAFRSYLETGLVPARLLWRAAGILWFSLSLSWVVLAPGPIVTGLLLVVGVSVSLHFVQLSRAGRARCPHRS